MNLGSNSRIERIKQLKILIKSFELDNKNTSRLVYELEYLQQKISSFRSIKTKTF